MYISSEKSYVIQVRHEKIESLDLDIITVEQRKELDCIDVEYYENLRKNVEYLCLRSKDLLIILSTKKKYEVLEKLYKEIYLWHIVNLQHFEMMTKKVSNVYENSKMLDLHLKEFNKLYDEILEEVEYYGKKNLTTSKNYSIDNEYVNVKVDELLGEMKCFLAKLNSCKSYSVERKKEIHIFILKTIYKFLRNNVQYSCDNGMKKINDNSILESHIRKFINIYEKHINLLNCQ